MTLLSMPWCVYVYVCAMVVAGLLVVLQSGVLSFVSRRSTAWCGAAVWDGERIDTTQQPESHSSPTYDVVCVTCLYDGDDGYVAADDDDGANTATVYCNSCVCVCVPRGVRVDDAAAVKKKC